MTAQAGRVLPALAAATITVGAAAQTVSIEKITNAASANDITPDGRYIVGRADTDNDGFADDLYRLDTVLNTMLTLPAGANNAIAVSDDGTVIVGDMPDPGDGVEIAGMWTQPTGWQSLGWLPDSLNCPSRSNAYEISADGSVVVGLSWDGCSGRGFLWTQATGIQELEALANGGCRASVVSADGTLVAGFAQGSFSRTPAIWNGTTLAGTLIGLDGADAQGEVYGMRRDGSVLLGRLWLGENWLEAVRWTQVDGTWTPEKLGEGSIIEGWAGNPMDIADNGTIVGFDSMMTSRRAWIQPYGVGELQELVSWIEAHGGVVPPSYPLEVCQAITPDGTTIIGHGFLGAWKMTIDWPCTGDLNDDDVVDVQDFLVLLANWNTDGPGAEIAEPFDNVDVADFLGLLAAWGPCP